MTTLPTVGLFPLSGSELVMLTDHHGRAAVSSVHENVAGSSSTASPACFPASVLLCVADFSHAKFTAIYNEPFRARFYVRRGSP